MDRPSNRVAHAYIDWGLSDRGQRPPRACCRRSPSSGHAKHAGTVVPVPTVLREVMGIAAAMMTTASVGDRR